jgi:membrane protease YdiL (CAAX protease family)
MKTQKTNMSENSTAGTSIPAIQAAGWMTSILLFGIPAGGVALFYYGLRPWLESQGFSPLTSYLAALCVPLALMFAAALIAYHRVEKRPLTWAAFSERMRFPKLRGRDVLLGLAIFLAGGIGMYFFSMAATVLIQKGIIILPSNLPLLDNPNINMSLDVLKNAADGQIHGQWSIAILYLVVYFFNIAGEEFWWRGYIFPRQELFFGRYTWVIHGLMWALFHSFKYWDVLSLVPICLLIAFSAQKLKNNWPGLIAHALMNISGPLFVLYAVIK